MKIFSVIAALYIAIGVMLALFHPRLGNTTLQLRATQRGIDCNADRGLALTFLWPLYLDYYYSDEGGFQTCRRSLFTR
jgi:hypothetical protein